MKKTCVTIITVMFCCFVAGNFLWSQKSEDEADVEQKNDLKKEASKTLLGKEDWHKMNVESYLARFPSGDYSKLKFIINSSKKTYEQGDKVLIDFSAYNDSSDEIAINPLSAALFCVYKITLHDSRGKPVQMTSFGKKFKKMQTEVGMLFPRGTSIGFERIPPQESRRILPAPAPPLLNFSLYYDLSRTGNYKLTVECLTVIPGQKFDPPLKSNTIEFKIVDYHVPDISEPEITTKEK